MRPILLPYMDFEQVANEIGDFIIRTVTKVGATGAVMGVSGGVDSTTVAGLANRAFNRYNFELESGKDKKLELVGYMLPSNTNNPVDLEDGKTVVNKLGIRNETQSIEQIVNAYGSTNPEALRSGYDKGNLMSRIRGNLLSTKSATERKVVLGTGNNDEDFGIGYYTLFGDGAVHCSPIGGLSKRLVRQMACYLGFNELAERVPTAGLEPGQTDFSDLGYSYDVVEIVVEGIEQGFSFKELVNHPQVIDMVNPELSKSKYDGVRQVVENVFDRHYNVALPKREIIHPPNPKITLNYEIPGGVCYGK